MEHHQAPMDVQQVRTMSKYPYSVWFQCKCTNGAVLPKDTMEEAIQRLQETIIYHRSYCKRKTEYLYIRINQDDTRIHYNDKGIAL